MKAAIYILSSILLVVMMGCGASEKRVESYKPSEDLIAAKSDTPVYEVFDRWKEEREESILYGDKIVSKVNLVPILANDPSPLVGNTLRERAHYETAFLTSYSIATLAGLALLLSIDSEEDSSERKRKNASNRQAALEFAALAVPIAFYSNYKVRVLTERAVSLHNERIRVSKNKNDFMGVEVELSF